MQCTALIDPRQLAELMKELDSAEEIREYESAFTCVSPSLEEPGRERLWIVPRDINAGANPSLWLRENAPLLQKLIVRSVVHCSVVFAGQLPANVVHGHISINIVGAQSEGAATWREPRRVRREIRMLSAEAHLLVDRLRLHTAKGDVDQARRERLLTEVATRYWNPEKENAYVVPTLRIVEGSKGEDEKAMAQLLDKTKPTCFERGLIVLYGPGGIGKTFFLHRLAYRLGMQAKQGPTASIPVFVHLPPVLHRDALEIWLSQHGFDKLTLNQIMALIRWGVVIPLLDALDEVVKGEARQGSRDFLDHIVGLISPKGYGRGVLACRDYYINSDSLVPDMVRESEAAELLFGFFGHQERRAFLQARADLEPEHASRWTTVLEEETRKILGEESAQEVEGLIGNPVVLDLLAQYIKGLAPSKRMTAADEFRLTSPDIFGQIVDQLLGRERDKVVPGWRESFTGRLNEKWLDPFAIEMQRRVLRELTLVAAQDGAQGVEAKASENESYKELRHGAFLFTRGVPSAANPREALELLLRGIVGLPEAATTVAENEREGVQREALRHLAEAYATHILADTEPGLPGDLIFALRHRAYFDYFLADALVMRLDKAISNGRVEDFLEWCRRYHVYDTFGTCLDFLLWDPRVVREGLSKLFSFLRGGGPTDDVLASYLVSLALALFLRRRRHRDRASIEDRSFAPIPDWELLLIREMLPESLSDLHVRACSFPHLCVDGIDFRNLHIDSCDFEGLHIVSSRFSCCQLSAIECSRLHFGGTVIFHNCLLELGEGAITIENGANVELYNCKVNEQVKKGLEENQSAGANVKLIDVAVVEVPAAELISQTRGRRFVNRLMTLLRKEGYREFAVHEYKLRDRTPGTDDQFAAAIDCLQECGCLIKQRPMIVMTVEGASRMYHPKSGIEPSYETHSDYWEPIIHALDQILGS